MSWYNASWLKRKKITVLASKVYADHSYFPIPIDLANLDADFHTNVNSDGSDLRVTEADEVTEVAIDLLYYDAANDKGLLIFKGAPDGDTDTDYYLYYGNADADAYAEDDEFGREAVYDSCIKGFWWLGTDPTSGIPDRTVNNNNLTHRNMTSGNLETGLSCIGEKGIDFNGTDENLYIASGSQTGLTITTTGLFLWALGYGETKTPIQCGIIAKFDGTYGDYFMQRDTNGQLESISNWDAWLTKVGAWPNDNWKSAFAWWDGGTTAYIAANADDVLSSTDATLKDMPDGGAGEFALGYHPYFGRYFHGKIVFAMVAQPSISAGFFDDNFRKTMYNAYMDNVNFYTEGDEEDAPAGSLKGFIGEGFFPFIR